MNIQIIFKFIAILQFFGGVGGIYLIVSNWGNDLSLYFVALVLCFLLLSIYASIELWRSNSRGYKLTFLNQILQIVWIYGPVVSYEYYSGLTLWFGFKSGTIVNTMIGTLWFFSYKNPNIEFGIGINIIPVLVIIFLIKNKSLFQNQIKEEVVLT